MMRPMLALLAGLLLPSARAGGPSDLQNPDCDVAFAVAPASCMNETTLKSYVALSQFMDIARMDGPETNCAKLYAEDINMTNVDFCSLRYLDTSAMKAFRKARQDSGATAEELTEYFAKVKDVKITGMCPLLCKRCQPYAPPPPPPCVDDPDKIMKQPSWAWPFKTCPQMLQMMGGGDLNKCKDDTQFVTGRKGYLVKDFCPVTCKACPPPPPPPGCQFCPAGTWASDLATHSKSVPAGVRGRCDACPRGTFRTSTEQNTRCRKCSMGSYNNVTGSTEPGNCLTCKLPGCNGGRVNPAKWARYSGFSGQNFAEELVGSKTAYPVRTGQNAQPMELGRSSLYPYTDADADIDTLASQLIAITFDSVGIPENSSVPESIVAFAPKPCGLPTIANTEGCFKEEGTLSPEAMMPLRVRIYAEATPDGKYAKSVLRDLSRRKRTNASVIWDVPPQMPSRHKGWYEAGINAWQFKMEEYNPMPILRTPDISPIVQEIVNMPGWDKGNHKITILFEHVSGEGIRWVGMDLHQGSLWYNGAFTPTLVWDKVPSEEELEALDATCGGRGDASGTNENDQDDLYPEWPEVGRTKCPICQPGEFDHDLNPATACEKCPSGTYNNVVGATTCTACPKNSVSSPGSRFQENCVPLMSVPWANCEPCNTMGGNCSLCPKGYVPGDVKQNRSTRLYFDYDECSYNNGGCDSRVKCTNSEGSFSCGPCPAGLQYNAEGKCVLPAIETNANSTSTAEKGVETVVPKTKISLGVPRTALEGTADQKAAFITTLKADLAKSLGVDPRDIVISNLAAAKAGRRLQAAAVAATFDFTIKGKDGPDAMVALEKQLSDPKSPLMQSNITKALTGMSVPKFVCPVGKRMGDGELVCRNCGPTSYTKDGVKCENCVVGYGPNSVATSVGDSCHCREKYYDAKEQLSMCFDDGFKQDEYNLAVSHFQNELQVGTSCQSCPTDAHGSQCFSCNTGQKPTVKAGYIHAQLPSTTSSRRSLAVVPDMSKQMQVHRCNDDMKLGVIRCPANPDFPGQCSKGYAGVFCNSCDEDYGMKGGTTTCEPCDDSELTVGAGFILAGVIVFLTLVVIFFVKFWPKLPGQHLIKSSFVPGRILVTYFQVTAQLGDVLNFPYPPAFAAVMEVIAPIIDFWGMLFRVMGVSPECLGLQGFTNSWLMRVVALPVVLCVVVLLIYVVERSRAADKAYSHAKGNLFLAVFFCYPTVCSTAFRAFMCKALTLTDTVLEADDKVLCEESDHRVIQVLSMIVTIVFAIGLPLALLFGLSKKARDYAKDDKVSNAGLARRVAEELEVDDEKAEYIIRDLVIGADYGFVMDAYDPKYLYWEAVDMLRKLALVGLVLVAGRGSVGQLVIALLLAFVFFALQARLCPYKIDEDNTLRAATELHVFLIIVAALVLQKTDISREGMDLEFYNWLLVISFIVLVPGAFIVAVISKVRFLKTIVSGTGGGKIAEAKLAFDRSFVGLANANDTELLKSYIDSLRLELASANFTNIISGAKWKADHPDAGLNSVRASDESLSAPLVLEAESTPEPATPSPSADADTDAADETPDVYYGKFDSGFEGTFADMSDYYGGLEKLIGDCRKDVMQAMEDEHCAVAEGYGWSDGQFETSSYRVVTTPRKEWFFVTSPTAVGDMSAGVDRETGRARGFRQKISPQELLENAAELITKSFVLRGFDKIVTPDMIKQLPLLLEEIIAMRLYTGPMFELYNTALRAYGNNPRGIVPAYSLVYPGLDVCGRFTTTLHALNSAVLKISRLQPAMQVYRGISRMKLPKAFTEVNDCNVRGGVEYGFMSTTADKDVAMMFAKDGDHKTASTLVTANMGMIDRGASLDWLSQYPHEQEILLPPLTAMEVLDITDFEDDGKFQIRKINVRLNCNMMSMTLEKLLAQRKKQVAELCGIALRDIDKHDVAADIPIRAQKLQKSAAVLEIADSQKFNDNKFFLDQSRMIQDLMPQIGDCIQVLSKHSKDVYGLISTDSNTGFASSSWDGTVMFWAADEHQVYDSVSEERLPAASLALDYLSEKLVVSAQLDGCLAVQSCSYKGAKPLTTALRPELHVDHTGIVAVAVLRGDQTEECAISIEGSPAAKQESTGDTPTLMVSGSQAGQIVLWDLRNEHKPQEVQSIGNGVGHTDAVRSLVWGSNNTQPCVVSGSFDGQIIVWRLSASTGLLELEKRLCDHSCTACSKAETAHKGAVTSLVYIGAFGDSQEVLTSGSEDGTVKLWDLDSGHVGPIRTVGDFNRGICSLEWLAKPQHSGFGPAGWLASGLGDSTIAISEPDTGKVLATLRGHEGPVHALLWLQPKGWLVSGSADGTIRTWRVRSDSNVMQSALIHPESKVGSTMLNKMNTMRSKNMEELQEGVPPTQP